MLDTDTLGQQMNVVLQYFTYNLFLVTGTAPSAGGHGGQYENIDQPVPTNHVESPDDRNPYSDKSQP